MSKTESYEEFLVRLRSCVRQVRKDSSKTQIEFAGKREGLTQSAIAKLESGSTANIGLRTVFEFAQACEIPLSSLIELAESTDSSNEGSWLDVEKRIKALAPERKEQLAKLIDQVMSFACRDN